MKVLRRKFDDNVTALSILERILREGNRFVVASIPAQAVVNQTLASQSVETALKEVTTPVLIATGEDMVNGLAERHMSKGRPVSNIQHTESRSLARLEDMVLDQFASIYGTSEEPVFSLLGNAGPKTKSGPATKVLVVIRTVVNRSISKAYYGTAFRISVERELAKRMAEPYVADDVALHATDLQVFTSPVAKFVRNGFEKHSLKKGKLHRHRNLLNIAVVGDKTKAEDWFLP